MHQIQSQGVVATGLHHLPLRARDSSASTTTSSHSINTKSSALTGSTIFHPHAQIHNHSHQSLKDMTPSGGLRHRRCPENLTLLNGGAVSRLRSPTESSLGSCSIPDSATTTYSPVTLASPLSSSCTSDLQDLLAAATLASKGSRPNSRVQHRHRPSTATCSTFVNDEDEVPVMVGFPDHLKRATICRNNYQEHEDGDMEVTPHKYDDTLPMR